MRFIKDTLSFIFQVLLIIFVNLFFADFIVLFIILALCMYANEDSNICQYLDLVYPILKFPSLPILYNILYKISKNKIILGFIHLLKTNILFKIFITKKQTKEWSIFTKIKLSRTVDNKKSRRVTLFKQHSGKT